MLMIFLILFFVVVTKADNDQPFYDFDLDHVENINSYSFKTDVLRSNRVTILEHYAGYYMRCYYNKFFYLKKFSLFISFFYAGWCSTCRTFKITWKEFAILTKLWHAKVLRVAAIDCVSIVNDMEVCRKNEITSYPKFRMYWGNNKKDFLFLLKIIYL